VEVMALKDLNKLAVDSKEMYSSTFINKDIKLPNRFKEKFSQVLETTGASIRFLDYSAEIIRNSQNRIFLPNQWFYLATFMVDFVSELIKYKDELEKICFSLEPHITRRDFWEKVKSLKGKDKEKIDPLIKTALINHFNGSHNEIEFMNNFITNYEWWFGQKTIDRSDFYVSPVLKLLGLVNVTQSYVAEIVYFLASDINLRREAEDLLSELSSSAIVSERKINGEEKGIEEKNFSIPKNLILYGPPGTGKTFETVELSLKICGRWTEDMASNRIQAVKVFNELQDEGRIEFVTFHQSMSYEEFIEGLSAHVHNNEVVYQVKDGIFKKICKRARREIFYKGAIINNYEIVKINKNIISVKNSNGAISPIPIDLIEDIAKNVLEGRCTLDDVRRGENKERVSVLYDNYILGYKSILSSLVNYYIENMNKISKKNNYVLIIDEINRANISKVFGELITLIEEDKREGENNELKVCLPYSQEYFSIPNNVYIIGTMNTADRSIAMIDIALRRRFEFKEIMPRLELLGSVFYEDDEINLGHLLEVINKRITVLLDRNYTIGQSIFINVSDVRELASVIKYKLIPLLQEYFYEDWEKISLVLGDNQKSDPSLKLIIKDYNYNVKYLFGNIDFVNEDEFVYTVNPNFGIDEEKDFHIIKSIYAQES
jgi:hypothetical protein